jgi:hypothetical protein
MRTGDSGQRVEILRIHGDVQPATNLRPLRRGCACNVTGDIVFNDRAVEAVNDQRAGPARGLRGAHQSHLAPPNGSGELAGSGSSSSASWNIEASSTHRAVVMSAVPVLDVGMCSLPRGVVISKRRSPWTGAHNTRFQHIRILRKLPGSFWEGQPGSAEMTANRLEVHTPAALAPAFRRRGWHGACR